MRITVRVPATSANLGPGFDSFGLALDLCNEFSLDTEAEPGVTWEGVGAEDLPTDGSDMVSRSMRHVERDAQMSIDETIALPPFRLHGLNRVPLEQGLGSSATAAVAGAVLAVELLDHVEVREPLGVVSLAAEFEGHADNVSAAVFGGFTIATRGSGARLDPHPAIQPVVLIPEGRLSTAEARAALPEMVPMADAVFNIGNAALMVHAMTVDPWKLFAAVGDHLHQARRLALVPDVRDVFDRLNRVPVPVCVSGAGPSLLAFEIDEEHTVPEDLGDGWTVLRPGVRASGYEVSVEA